jgi:hypothetical protein
MTNLEWWEFYGADVLRNTSTVFNVAMVKAHPDLGYSVMLWDADKHPQGDWVEIATTPDRESAKMIAILNVEGTLV